MFEAEQGGTWKCPLRQGFLCPRMTVSTARDARWYCLVLPRPPLSIGLAVNVAANCAQSLPDDVRRNQKVPAG